MGTTYDVRDVWAHTDLPVLTGDALHVGPVMGGDSRFLVLKPR
jgi:hypothetical protein